MKPDRAIESRGNILEGSRGIGGETRSRIVADDCRVDLRRGWLCVVHDLDDMRRVGRGVLNQYSVLCRYCSDKQRVFSVPKGEKE